MSPPPLSHVLYEVLVSLLWLGCAVHAFRRGKHALLQFLTFFAYGLLIEYVGLNYRSPPDYTYGDFYLVLARGAPQALPLCIALGWGCIIHAGMQAARHLERAPWYLAPFAAALLGIGIDLVIDPIASGPMGLAMWRWNPAADAYWWMGVPVTNYFGWFVVLLNLSLFTTLGHKLFPTERRGAWQVVLVPVGVVLASVVVDTIELLTYIRYVWRRPAEIVGLFLLIGVGAATVLLYRPRLERAPRLDWTVLSVPIFFYGYFLSWYFLTGAHRASGGLWWLGAVLALAGLFFYTMPYAVLRGSSTRRKDDGRAHA
ncbi:hypothetical protein [Sorangium sp. So ce131]|uniref:hypothetical protein n=1 Tax=Sorangium sp. So ce131 TaxID=3133282 RepID=UPI003F5FFDC5